MYLSCKILFADVRKRNAQLAQLVEQRTENPRVSGSIPELGILYSIEPYKNKRRYSMKIYFRENIFFYFCTAKPSSEKKRSGIELEMAQCKIKAVKREEAKQNRA